MTNQTKHTPGPWKMTTGMRIRANSAPYESGTVAHVERRGARVSKEEIANARQVVARGAIGYNTHYRPGR